MEDNIPEIPFVRGELLEKVNRVSYYVQTRALVANMMEAAKNLENDLENDSEEKGWSHAQKEKQRVISQNKRHRLERINTQVERLVERLGEMEKQIRIDIDSEE